MKPLLISEIISHNVESFTNITKLNLTYAFGLRLDLDKSSSSVMRLICVKQPNHDEFNCAMFHDGSETVVFKWTQEELCQGLANMLDRDNWHWIKDEYNEIYFTCFGMGIHGPPFWTY